MIALRMLVTLTKMQFVWGFLRNGPVPLLWGLLWPATFLVVFAIGFNMSGQHGGAEFLVPGLIGVQLVILGVSGLGVQLAAMRERNMLRNVHLVPMPAWVFFTALILYRFIFMMVQAATISVVGAIVFHARFTGDFASVALVLLVGSGAFVAIGALVGAVARDVQSANAVSMIVSGPLILFSDGYIPLDRFPHAVSGAARLLPTTQFIDTLRGVATGGESLLHFWVWLAVLAFWALGATTLSARTFKWV